MGDWFSDSLLSLALCDKCANNRAVHCLPEQAKRQADRVGLNRKSTMSTKVYEYLNGPNDDSSDSFHDCHRSVPAGMHSNITTVIGDIQKSLVYVFHKEALAQYR